MGSSERTPAIPAVIRLASCLLALWCAAPLSLHAQEPTEPTPEIPAPIEESAAANSEESATPAPTPSEQTPAFEPIAPVESSDTTRLRFDELLASFELARAEFFRAYDETADPDARRALSLDKDVVEVLDGQTRVNNLVVFCFHNVSFYF